VRSVGVFGVGVGDVGVGCGGGGGGGWGGCCFFVVFLFSVPGQVLFFRGFPFFFSLNKHVRQTCVHWAGPRLIN